MSVSVSPFIVGQGHTEKSIRTAYNTNIKRHCCGGTLLSPRSRKDLEQEEYMTSQPASIGERPPVPEKAKGSEWEVDVRELAKRLKDWLSDTKEGDVPLHLRRKIYRAKQVIAKARDARRKQL